MKEKRYFCDIWFGPSKIFKYFTTMMLLSLTILIAISSVISYNIILSKFGYELDAYSESTHLHLNEIADNVISKGQGIDLTAIPSDVVQYEIEKEDDGTITFKYSLDNNKGMQFAPSANMTIELSENFEIISKRPTYLSEEEYVRNTKLTMAFVSFAYGAVTIIGVTTISLVGCTIAALISRENKKKDMNLS